MNHRTSHSQFYTVYLITILFIVIASPILNAQSSTGEADSVFEQTASEVDAFFSQPSMRITFNPDFTPDANTALAVTDNIAFFVDFQDPRMPLGITVLDETNSVTIHPDTFIGGAVLTSDREALDPQPIDATQVSKVTTSLSSYRELCAFDHRVGGPVIAGTVLATLSNGDTVALGAEVGTSMTNFEPLDNAATSGGLVISWPNKYCRGVKRNNGSCQPKACDMTLGDMIELAGDLGLEIPGDILAGGVDAVTEWLIGQNISVSGTCGEVEIAIIGIPLGCQCIYVQF